MLASVEAGSGKVEQPNPPANAADHGQGSDELDYATLGVPSPFENPANLLGLAKHSASTS